MALVVYDRVQQTGTANTTVSFTLTGTVTGYQSFSVVGNGNTTYYAATDASGNWEVGIGTYSTTGPTFTRTTILSSSNSGSAVTFSGTVNVFVTYPSENAVYSSNTPTSGYVLTANASGVAPSWQATASGVYTRTSFTATAGQTSFTVSYSVGYAQVYQNGVLLNSTDYTASSGTAIVLASGAATGDIIEVVAFNTGGVATLANLSGGSAGVVPYQSATNVTAFTAAGTSGQAFLSGGTGSPTWGTLSSSYGGTGFTTYTTGDVIYASATNTISKLGIGSTGNVLTVSGGVPTWAAPATSGTVTSVTFTGGLITVATNTTTPAFTVAGTSGGIPYFDSSTSWASSAALAANALVIGGGAGVTPATLASTGTTTTVLHGNASGAPTFGAVSLTADVSGTLPIANGGTNATTAAAANANLQGFTTIATAGSTTVLSNTSTYYQYFTGTLAQTITLPLNTTIQNGWSFHIANNSTGNLTINSNSGALVNTVLPGTTVHVTCVDATVNTAAAWDSGTTDFATVTGTGSVVLSTSPTLVTPALGTPASGTLTNCTGLLATGGGTGLSTYTTGDTLYSSAANTLSKLAIGTTGQVLSIASGIPAWSSSSSASVFTTGTSQTYTVPAGVTRVKVTIQGPGGTGGGTGTTNRATGGSAGGTCIKWLTVTPGDTMTYTVGTATGTNSTVVYSAVTYTGASGSAGTTTAYAVSQTAGPAGGSATNGDINITGQSGGTSYGTGTTVGTNFSGQGGNSQFGQGGQMSAITAVAGKAAVGYGAGGGGSIGNATGGAAAGGIIIFEPY